MQSKPFKLVLKVDLGGDVRRQICEVPDPSFEYVVVCVARLFALSASSLVLRFRDGEGEFCVLERATFESALGQARANRGVMRLLMTVSAHPQAPEEGSTYSSAKEETASRALGVIVADSARYMVQMPEGADVELLVAPPSEHPLGHSAGSASQLLLKQHFDNFGRDFADDFWACRRDMRQAFLGQARGKDAPIQRKVGNVVGSVFGAVVALRMAPIRATRLVAESVAVLSGAVGVERGSCISASRVSAGLTVQASVLIHEQLAHQAEEQALKHFKRQVKGDFAAARKEIRDVLGFYCGCRNSASCHGHQQDLTAEKVQGLTTLREALPVAASTIVGVTVAATLVPVRAVRLGVAAGRRGVCMAVAATSGIGGATSAKATEMVDPFCLSRVAEPEQFQAE